MRKAKPLNKSPYSIQIDGDLTLDFRAWVQKVILQHCDHQDAGDCWIWGKNYGVENPDGPYWRVPNRYGDRVSHRRYVLVPELVAVSSPIIGAPGHGRIDIIHPCGNDRCCNPLHIMWDYSDEHDRGR